MKLLNFEFKAATNRLEELEAILLEKDPVFKGEDIQTDTYFNVANGRLKLREGNIENSLIYYIRENTAGAKQSDVILYAHTPDKALKDILAASNGIKIVVEKTRRIYFIGNVKFHFDSVPGLGTFVEVEAIDTEGETGIAELKEQCSGYAKLFGIKEEDYISRSYSDLLLDNR